ncbi:unnamed protein product [Macrosiphum euphorbiae]|uniref:Uncharacterized protein n=1 Tax=Macrosiphum euphorbiae TaxID=13131 RepID=A0AAV0WTU7_9HEMI|nr:unnamed protein product [Macrosiphum euphorbiae]
MDHILLKYTEHSKPHESLTNTNIIPQLNRRGGGGEGPRSSESVDSHSEPHESPTNTNIIPQLNKRRIGGESPRSSESVDSPVVNEKNAINQSKQFKVISTPRIKLKHNSISDEEFRIIMTRHGGKTMDDDNEDNDDDHHDSNGLECEFIPDMPDIPLIPSRKLVEALREIRKNSSNENAELVTSSDSDMSDDELKIDSGADDDDDDDEEIDNCLLINIESYISSTTSHQQTLPNKTTTVGEIEVEKNDDDVGVELIENDIKVHEEVKSSKTPEVTKPQLTQNVQQPQFLSNIYSRSSLTQNKSPKNQSLNVRYRPYNILQTPQTPPQKSMEIQNNITHNSQL